MPPPPHHVQGKIADDSTKPRPETDPSSPGHRQAAELAGRIAQTIRILQALDLTGIPPAPVFTTGHGEAGARGCR